METLKSKSAFKTGAFTLVIIFVVIIEIFYRQPLFDWSLNAIETIQKDSSASLDSFWEVITVLGTQAVLLPMFFIIYIFKPLKCSYLFLSVLSLSVFIDNLMKNVYANPRPYMENPKIIIKHCDAGFGNPSGHSFSSSATYLAFWHIMTDIKWFKVNIGTKIFRVMLCVLTILMIAAIMFSRFYLGVHSLNQLIYGSQLGFILYFFYFFYLDFHKYSHGEFFNLFYKLGSRIAHGVLFVALIVLNFGLYLFNTHDTTNYNKIIEQYCPKIYLYRRFDNDAGINSLTIFAMIGAYVGLALILSWRNSIDREGERYEELDNWNSTNCKRFWIRLALTLILVAVSMSLFLIISGHSSIPLIIVFKIILSFLLAGLCLFGLIIYLSIKFKLAHENFDIMEGGYIGKLNERDDVIIEIKTI